MNGTELTPSETEQDPLLVSIEVPRPAVLEYESIPFSMTVQNRSRELLGGLHGFDQDDRDLRVRLEGDGLTRSADQWSARLREGVRYHPKPEPVRIRLVPGEAKQVTGDMLEWFGRLAPGSYSVSADLESLVPAESAQPVPLNIEAGQVTSALHSRAGDRAPAAPLAAGFIHESQTGPVLYYQLHSSALPSNPMLGTRIGEVPEHAAVQIAAIPAPRWRYGHAVWHTNDGGFELATIDLEDRHVVRTPGIEPPFAGRCAWSPRCAFDGSVWAPWIAPGGERAAVFNVLGAAVRHVHELRPGSLPITGPYCCHWNGISELYFAWTDETGLRLRCAQIDFLQKAEFVPVIQKEFDAPLRWIDASSEGLSAAALWFVQERDREFAIGRLRTATGERSLDAIVPCGDLDGVSPVASAVTALDDLALLCADGQGRLHYATTRNPVLRAVRDAKNGSVTASQFPGLLTAGVGSAAAWVCLRYIDTTSRSLEFLVLEP